MKYITFIRHANSDETTSGQSDFDRDLNERGKRVAPKMGRKLRDLNLNPNKIYSSSAKRAKETSNLLVEQLDYSLGEISFVDDLYEASVRTLLDFINKLDDQFHDVVIVGYNPSITYLVEYLTGEPIEDMPTTGVVRTSFAFDEWKLISQKTAELIYFVNPKEFDF